MSDLGVTIADLVTTMKARKLRVPAEIGTFVALECAERLLDGPALVTMKDVRLSEEGLVSLFVAPGSASAEAAAQSLVSMLGGLLVAAGTAVPTHLIGIVESGGPSGPNALVALRDQLEAALVPLNRQAARRVLSRMIREARRPATERPPAPTAGGLDDAIDALLDGGATAPYPTSGPPTIDLDLAIDELPLSRERTDDQTAPRVLERAPAFPEDPIPTPARAAPKAEPPAPQPSPAQSSPAQSSPAQSSPAQSSPAQSSPAQPSPPAQRAPQPVLVSAPAPQPAPVRPSRGRPSSDDEQAPRKPRPIELADDLPSGSRGGGTWLVLATLIAVIACVALYFATQRPELVDSWLGRPSADQLPDAAVPLPPPQEAGTLEVESTPSRAQVFLFVGRGPVVVEDLPVGVAHEFVVIADGHRPQRVIVPADAVYEPHEQSSRYELAAQVGPALAPGDDPQAIDLGPSLMPAAPGTAGDLASVRVITNPPGAKVYMLVGFTPDVHVENLSAREATELLVWAEGHRLERVVVGPSDWQGQGSEQQAHIRTTLTPLGRR